MLRRVKLPKKKAKMSKKSNKLRHHHPEVEYQLTYYVAEGILVGTVAGKDFHIAAVSGGVGASTNNTLTGAVDKTKAVVSSLKNGAPAHTHVPGGPIPTGSYSIEPPAKHPTLGLSARLDTLFVKAVARDGFYIHGNGPHGSDGCIVPVVAADFQRLMTALRASDGGYMAVLASEDDVDSA